MLHHKTVVDRLLAGEIQPPTLPGILEYMGLTQDAMGRDAYDYRWAEEYRHAVAGEGGPHGTRDVRHA
jgi:toluene monooxygenase system protein A